MRKLIDRLHLFVSDESGDSSFHWMWLWVIVAVVSVTVAFFIVRHVATLQ